MILMIDNYDSFTYNIVQYLAELKADVKVVRNDEISIYPSFINLAPPDLLVFADATPLLSPISMADGAALHW